MIPDRFHGTDIDERLTEVINLIKAEWDRDRLVQDNSSVFINETSSELDAEMSSEVHSETGSSTVTDDFLYDSHLDNWENVPGAIGSDVAHSFHPLTVLNNQDNYDSTARRNFGGESFQAYFHSQFFSGEIIRYIRYNYGLCQQLDRTVPASEGVPLSPWAEFIELERSVERIVRQIRMHIDHNDERDSSTTSTHDSSTTDSEHNGQDGDQHVDVSVDVGIAIGTEYSAYSYNGNNWINTHRMIVRPGITMRRDFRCRVAWLPRAYILIVTSISQLTKGEWR